MHTRSWMISACKTSPGKGSFPFMDVRSYTAAAVTVLGLVGLVSCKSGRERALGPQFTPEATKGRSVLLVTLDAASPDQLGCYRGRARTPTFDRLASEGMRFLDAVTSSVSSFPSCASIMTGLFAPRHGARADGIFRLKGQAHTLAEMMSEAGYSTGAFVSGPALQARFGLDQGFAKYDSSEIGLTGDGSGVRGQVEKLFGKAGGWVTSQSDAPWFLWVHVGGDGELRVVDDALGGLIVSLETAGRWRDAVVIVVGTYGAPSPGVSELSLDEKFLRIPLLVHAPDAVPGYLVGPDLASTVDVLPTILELTGSGSRSAVFDGRSLLGPVAPDRVLYFENGTRLLRCGMEPIRGVRRSRDKYIDGSEPVYLDLQGEPVRHGSSASPSHSQAELQATLRSWISKWESRGHGLAERIPIDEMTRDVLIAPTRPDC